MFKFLMIGDWENKTVYQHDGLSVSGKEKPSRDMPRRTKPQEIHRKSLEITTRNRPLALKGHLTTNLFLRARFSIFNSF